MPLASLDWRRHKIHCQYSSVLLYFVTYKADGVNFAQLLKQEYDSITTLKTSATSESISQHTSSSIRYVHSTESKTVLI